MESIFAQQYRPVEVIAVDDGSTDNTPWILKQYGDRIRYFRQENGGVAVARNTACRLSKGELVAFQDDDDLMPPNRIVDLYSALQAYPAAVMAVGDWAAIDADGNLTGQRSVSAYAAPQKQPILITNGYEAVMWPKVPAAPHTTLFRKAAGERTGWFDVKFQNAGEDKDFFARLGQLGPIVYMPKVVSLYRVLQSGSLTTNTLAVACDQILLFEKHLNQLSSDDKNLRRQLQFRIWLSLRMILSCLYEDEKVFGLDSERYLKKGLALLGPIDRLNYRLRQFKYFIWRLHRYGLQKSRGNSDVDTH